MRIVIDTGAWGHGLRRWWWRVTNRTGSDRTRCYDCGKPLNAPERQFYGHTCERCVGIEAGNWRDL